MKFRMIQKRQYTRDARARATQSRSGARKWRESPRLQSISVLEGRETMLHRASSLVESQLTWASLVSSSWREQKRHKRGGRADVVDSHGHDGDTHAPQPQAAGHPAGGEVGCQLRRQGDTERRRQAGTGRVAHTGGGSTKSPRGRGTRMKTV